MTHLKIASTLAGVLACMLIAFGCSSDAVEETDVAAPAAAAADSAAPATEPGEYKVQQTFPLEVELTSTVLNGTL